MQSGKRVAILFFLFSVWLPVFGQNRILIDSLREQQSVSKGEKLFAILNAIAWEYRFAYPDSTIKYASQAYALGTEINIQKNLATPLNYIAIAHNYNGNRLTALEYHQKAIEVASSQNDSVSIAHAYNTIGRVYFEQGMMQQAIDYYFKAQKIFEAIHDLSGMAYVYQSLGNLYRTQGEFNSTLDYYTRALSIREQLGNRRNIMAANVLLGRLYQDNKQFDKSNEYLLKGVSIGQELQDEIQLAEIEIFLSQNYLQTNQLAEAEQICKKALNAVEKVQNIRMLPLVCVTLGEIYLAQNNQQQAVRFLQRALTSATTISDVGSMRDANYWLWKIAQKQGNALQSLQFQNQYLILRDSTTNLELAREVERLRFQLEVEKRDSENELLKASELRKEAVIRQQRLQNVILIAAVIIGVVAVILLSIYNKRRKKLYEKLTQQNEQIKLRNQQLFDLNNEKDTLMNIMVHDLKSPLNNIHGLTTLIELDGGVNQNQEYYLKLIKDSSISGLEMITDLLDAHAVESSKGLSIEPVELHDFLTHRIDTFMKTAQEKKITIDFHTEPIIIDTDRGYLTRILDNLISNAIKFSPASANVSIRALRADNAVVLSIKDQGLGFTEDDKRHLFKKFKKLSTRPTAGESSNGLGLAIVKILIDRLGGSIRLESTHGQGSEFIVTFPDMAAQPK